MGKLEKILADILRGVSDRNIRFDDLCWILKKFGFIERIKGSHHIFVRDRVEEIINLQPKENFAKPYQVKQVRNIILRYKLGDLCDE